MPRFVFDSLVEVAPELLFAWHEQQGAFHRMLPPWSDAEVRRYDGLRLGAQTEIRIPFGPGHVTWLTETREIEQGRSFTDVQVKGPFRRWEHTHHIASVGSNRSRLIDRIDLEFVRPIAWTTSARDAIEHRLSRAFTYRHTITRNDLLRVRQYTTAQPLRVAISGSNGLIGKELRHLLDAAGHDVYLLVRHQARDEHEIHFDYRTEAIDSAALQRMDVVVHLAGASMERTGWTPERRTELHASRVHSTELLTRALAGLQRPPRTLITAGTTGFYGDRPGEILDETAGPGDQGFLTMVERDAEAAALSLEVEGIRAVHLRFGLVISPRNRLLHLLPTPMRIRPSARTDAARRSMGWIALDDALYAILHAAVEQSMQGPVNVVAPQPSTAGELIETLRRTTRVSRRIALPERALRAMWGESGSEFLLLDQHTMPRRLLDTQFRFSFPDLEAAVKHQFGRAEPLHGIE